MGSVPNIGAQLAERLACQLIDPLSNRDRHLTNAVCHVVDQGNRYAQLLRSSLATACPLDEIANRFLFHTRHRTPCSLVLQYPMYGFQTSGM